MSYLERIRNLMRRNTREDRYAVEDRSMAVKTKLLEELHRLSSPSSTSPFRFAAARLENQIHKGNVNVLVDEKCSGRKVIFNLYSFKCEAGRHLTPAIVINPEDSGTLPLPEMSDAMEGLLEEFEQLRQERDGIGRGLHRPGFSCDRGEVKAFAVRRKLITV